MSKSRDGNSMKTTPSRRKKASGESGRRSVQVNVAGRTQIAEARRSAESQLRTLIVRFAPAHHRLIGAIRRSLRKRLPTAHEVVYEYRDCFVISFSPSEHGYEGVLAIRGSVDGVKLYFNRGKDLPDPEKLLRGSGGQVRSIDVEGAPTLARPEIVRLIDEAIVRNRVPFASKSRGGDHAGRGSVIIRSTSAKSTTRRGESKTRRGGQTRRRRPA